MDILTNLQEYGVIGAAFTIVLIILKYNGKQGWKESLGLSDREKFFHLWHGCVWLCIINTIIEILYWGESRETNREGFFPNISL